MERLCRDGVALTYREAGSGDPPILLVHGWTCDHRSMTPQFEHFKKTHRVVAVDLRGHGQSDQPEQDYSYAVLADDLAWLCHEVGIEQPVVIGHSIGAAIAFELAGRHPQLPAAIVGLDAPVPLRPDLRAALLPLIEDLRTPNYREALCQFVAEFLAPRDDLEWRRRILGSKPTSPQYVIVSLIEHLLTWDYTAAAASTTAPVLNVCPAQPVACLARFRDLYPTLVVGQAVGASHFLQIEVPDQVNAMIDRFLTLKALRLAQAA